VKLPVIERSRSDKASQDITPKASSNANKNDKIHTNGYNTAFSSPIKKMKIPKIKREVPEVKSEVSKEFQSESAFNNIRKDLEREVVTDSTDAENESHHSSKRKRKLPAKFSDDFEVSLNKSNTPQRPKPVENSATPKKTKFSNGPTSKGASPLSQRTPSNTPKSHNRKPSPKNNYSSWAPPQPGAVGGVTRTQRLSGGSGGGGVSSPGKDGGGLDTSLVGVSSPGRFGHIKTETSSPRPEVEDTIVYRCPLHPCTWTCGKEGMRQGPAVLHLLRVHKIQPLEMRERGIKFDKIQA